MITVFINTYKYILNIILKEKRLKSKSFLF